MTYVRIGFLGAFVLLLVGGFTARNAVAPYFSSLGEPSTPKAASTPTARVEARRVTAPTATAIVITATPTAAPTATPRVIVVTPTARAVPSPSIAAPAGIHHRTARRSRPAVRPTATPTLVPTATPVPTTGVVALNNYWVDNQWAHPGQVIAIGYVIRNDTGKMERISLGASLKARSSRSWTAAINDPNHDVVAVVPPGATVHVRYFALPAGLRPGRYDVAWGLRDASTGQRLGLAFAPSVVTVTR